MALPYQLLLLSLLLPFSSCADPLGQYCSKSFNSRQTNANINRLLTDLISKASVGGFATSSSGKANNTIYGLAQCRGDVVGSNDCTACLSDAAKKLPDLCPDQADARIWYDYCFVRYDDVDFIGEADTGYALIYINVENATDPERFDEEVGKLMGRVRAQAVAPHSGGLGRAKTQFTPFVTIYGLGQCTEDLKPLACDQCLATAVARIPDYCLYRKGCRVLQSSCVVRYEIYPFFFPLDSGKKAAGLYSKAVVHP